MSTWKAVLYWCAAAIISVVIGGVAVQYLGDISWLSWLSYGADFGFGSTTLDLAIFKLTLGVWININVCQIILMLISGGVFFVINRR